MGEYEFAGDVEWLEAHREEIEAKLIELTLAEIVPVSKDCWGEQAKSIEFFPVPELSEAKMNAVWLGFERVRDLPEEDRKPFWDWLMSYGATRPVIAGAEDAYYPIDYVSWKAGIDPDD